MVRSAQVQFRRFRFTLNNPTAAETALFTSYLTTTAYTAQRMRFIILQTERGHGTVEVPEGTLHYQGYVEFSNGVRRTSTAIHRMPGFARCAVLTANASSAANITYCSKDDTRVDGLHGRNGTPVRTRSSDKRLAMIAEIKEGGMTAKKCIEGYGEQYLSSAANIEKMIAHLQPAREWPMEIVIYFGPTGTGKSWKAHHDHVGAYEVKWPEQGNNVFWWDRYEGGNDDGEGHDTVLWEEFRHNIPYGRMLKFFDRYGCKIKYHGGQTEFNSHRIVITTNIEPMNWYPKKDTEGISMLHRRFHDFATIYDFTLPTLAHWAEDYTGNVVKQFREIICVERTVPIERNTPGPLDFSNQSNRDGLGHTEQQNTYVGGDNRESPY